MVHRCLHFLSILTIGDVLVHIDLVLIIEITHRLQKLFLLFDLRNTVRALALLGVKIVLITACRVLGDVLTVDSWHRCLSIIRDIFIQVLRLVDGVVSLVSIVSILSLVHLANLSREGLRHVAELTYLANVNICSLSHFSHAVA